MKHLGDISKINGAEIEPVDIITFGSPCQDLSVAGKQAGISEGTRSGLFIEAVRIIKEMSEATDGKYPTFALWENVPGAFSSNKGEDFRIVLEELVKIVEPDAVVPTVPKKGWAYADSHVGDGWSLAYRTFDAQHWGVPQRRRRIHLVLDLRGQRARKVLFEQEGLRGYSPQSGTTWQGARSGAQGSPGAGSKTFVIDQIGGRGEYYQASPVNPTLRAGGQGAIAIENHPNDSRVSLDKSGKVQTLTQRMGTGGGNVPMVLEPTYCIQGNCIDRSDTAGCNGRGWREGESYTLNTIDRPAVVYAEPSNNYTVRRLTPTECARLQGFPDKWGAIDKKNNFTTEELTFWKEVRNTHAAINGRQVKDYTEKQMLTWYNKLQSDSAEYKMWGNGIALPPALYCMQGIAEALNEEEDRPTKCKR
jgi:DNA (cytosine-5)-methyltransferase 1